MASGKLAHVERKGYFINDAMEARESSTYRIEAFFSYQTMIMPICNEHVKYVFSMME